LHFWRIPIIPIIMEIGNWSRPGREGPGDDDEWARLCEAVEAAKQIVDESCRRAAGEVEVMRMVLREGTNGGRFGGKFFRPDRSGRGRWESVFRRGEGGRTGALDAGGGAWEDSS
jgi:hypothetical protein